MHYMFNSGTHSLTQLGYKKAGQDCLESVLSASGPKVLASSPRFDISQANVASSQAVPRHSPNSGPSCSLGLAEPTVTSW